VEEEELFELFDDLESQAGAAYARDREAERADRARSEYAEVSLASRLMASIGAEMTLEVGGVGRLAGTVERVAAGWLELWAPGSRWVVRQAAITVVAGASERAFPEVAWSPIARLGLGSALRGLGESGERCVVHLLDGTSLDGIPRRVGADFVELETPVRCLLVAFAGIAAVQSPG
jgi:hypothetical protein